MSELTRDEIRKLLTCPACKTPGSYLGDKCSKCGAYTDAEGMVHIPEERLDPPPAPKIKSPDPEPKPRKGKGGFFWSDEEDE